MGQSGYELAKLIDLDRVQRLCDSLSQAFDVTLAVLDLSGDVLIATGWQDICTDFHREHPETLRACLESDLQINQRLVQGLDATEHYAYRCSNGLWDVAFPLVVDGAHLANVYTGQFFFEDDDVDREAFAKRARDLGFDETAYLAALDAVPVISEARLQKTIGFLADFVGMLGELGLSALQHEQKHAQLVDSEQRYRRLFDNATEGLTVFRVERGPEGEVGDLVIADLNPTQSERTGLDRSHLLGRRRSECDGSDERLQAYFDVVTGAVDAGQPARCEVYLRGQEAYELLSAYPAADDLWVVSATDVIDLREAERALRRQEEGIRQAYVDVLDAVTGGKLILLTEEELAGQLGGPLTEPQRVDAPRELSQARGVVARVAAGRFPDWDHRVDVRTPVCEALVNALRHAGGGTYQVFSRDETLQVLIRDEGPGIDFRTLPRATLQRGFSTASSLGMGFTIMLQVCERVLLSTRPGRTSVVLEFTAGQPALADLDRVQAQAP
jgi:ligand-binding sensor protein/anti-sigma regulatory factor (Ser/Thr protein kinase)